jgi:hypothetical protein
MPADSNSTTVGMVIFSMHQIPYLTESPGAMLPPLQPLAEAWSFAF